AREPVADAEEDLLRVPAGQVGPADAALEERVARIAVQPEEKTDRSLGMARRVQNPEADVLERKGRVLGQAGVDGERPEAGGQIGQVAISIPIKDGEIIRMHGDRRAGFRVYPGHTADVVDVSVGHEDPLHSQPILTNAPQDAVDPQSRIDHEGSRRLAPPDAVAVLTEEIVGKDRNGELFAQRLGRSHPTPISQDAAVSTCGPLSVMSTISSRRTPPQPGM